MQSYLNYLISWWCIMRDYRGWAWLEQAQLFWLCRFISCTWRKVGGYLFTHRKDKMRICTIVTHSSSRSNVRNFYTTVYRLDCKTLSYVCFLLFLIWSSFSFQASLGRNWVYWACCSAQTAHKPFWTYGTQLTHRG